MNVLWTVESLKSSLLSWKNDHGIKDWVITVENLQRRERYFLSDGKCNLVVDQDREAHQQNVGLRLLVSLPDKPGKQGEIFKKLSLSQPLLQQVESALRAAKQTESDVWVLPSSLPDEIPEVQSFDPEIAEDMERALVRLTREIDAGVSEGIQNGSTFSSSELFVSLIQKEVHFSFGRVHRTQQSRVYVEAAFSAKATLDSGEVRSDEFLGTRWSVDLGSLGVRELFREAAENARRMLEVESPQAGQYAVLIDAEVLLKVFNEHLAQLSGGNRYHRLPFVAPGSELIPGASGDLITLKVDPTLSYGADTVILSDEGQLQRPQVLVENNVVRSSLVGGQYAQYLGVPATTTRGTVVLEPGKSTYRELIQSAPRVLEILQLSGLFTDANSGTFSSEIRLARLHDRETGAVKYVKGGSLSAAILENFKELRLSSEVVHRQHFETGSSSGEGYLGPCFALMNDVSIAV